jgi:hypothetical protein
MLSGTSQQALRLLLADPHTDLDHVDWAELRELAVSYGVIVRLADAVTAGRDELPERFHAAAALACARAQRALAIVDRLTARCEALGLAHAFLRTAEAYPDAGTVTLLVAAPWRPSVDREILEDLPAAPRSTRNLGNRLAGCSTFSTVDGIPVRLRHGRLGRLGEHARYARMLLGRAQRVRVGATSCSAPAPEDHCLMLAIERAYAPSSSLPRLDDLAWLIPMLWGQSLDWDYLFAAAVAIGMLEGLGAFLASVSGVHHQLFGRDVVDAAVLARFRGPSSHLRRLAAALEAGRWQSAARLSLRPIVAAVSARRAPRLA